MTSRRAQEIALNNAIREFKAQTHETPDGEQVAISPQVEETLKTIDLDKHYVFRIQMRGEPSGKTLDDDEPDMIDDSGRTVVHVGRGREFLQRTLYWKDHAIIDRLEIREVVAGSNKMKPLYEGDHVKTVRGGTVHGTGVQTYFPKRKSKPGRKVTPAAKAKQRRAETTAKKVAKLKTTDPKKAAEITKRSHAAKKGKDKK